MNNECVLQSFSNESSDNEFMNNKTLNKESSIVNTQIQKPRENETTKPVGIETIIIDSMMQKFNPLNYGGDESSCGKAIAS